MSTRQPTLPAESLARPSERPAAVAAAADIGFAALVAADLASNTGRRGFRAGLLAFVSDPSFSTVLLHRVTCKLRSAGFVSLSKLLWRLNVVCSGCHIHPDAVIGRALQLPHPTGIVVGNGARIGRSVTIYQNVTLGRGLRDARYPVVEDEVIIFPNSVIAGGVVIGSRAVIGAGSVVIADVPADSIVAGNPAKLLRMRSQTADHPG